MLLAVAVYEVEVVAVWLAGDVDVFAELDVAFGAEDEGASVAPCAEAVGGEPIDAEMVGGAVIREEGGFAIVFELGVLGVAVIGGEGVGDAGILGAAVEEELLDLVAADVAEDAAVLGALEEPLGATGGAQAVGAEAEDLDHASDGVLMDQSAGVNGALDVEALAIINGIFFPGAGDSGAGLIELIEGGEGGLVGEVILAGFHDFAAERAAVAGDGGGGDERDVGVGQDFIEAAGFLCLRIFGEEGGDLGGIGIVGPLELAAGFEEAVGLAVDVAVIEVGGGEDELAGFHDRAGAALRGVIHAVGFLNAHGRLLERLCEVLDGGATGGRFFLNF